MFLYQMYLRSVLLFELELVSQKFPMYKKAFEKQQQPETYTDIVVIDKKVYLTVYNYLPLSEVYLKTNATMSVNSQCFLYVYFYQFLIVTYP